MQQQLIEALLYPRKMVEELVQDGNYTHKNMFEATGERCNHCDGTGNCIPACAIDTPSNPATSF